MSETIRGGGHIGSNPWLGYRATWPLASLSVEPDTLTFSMWPVNYTFDKSTLRCLLKKRIMGWPALFIIHTNPAFSKSVVFHPLRFANLEYLLLKNGYKLTTEEPVPLDGESIRYSNTIPAAGYTIAIVGAIAALLAISVAIFVAKK
jgi:hypothetical protein